MSANSVLDIYNLACSQVPTRASIQDIGEDSVEADACNLWYENSLRAVLRAAPWPFASGYASLAVVKTRDWDAAWEFATSPPPEWGYEYALPANCIRPRFLTSFERFDLSARNNSHTLVTNGTPAILAYTKFEPNVSMWDDHFVLAVSKALAANITLKLSGKTNRARNNLEEANELIRQARASAANDADLGRYDSAPSWFAVRGVESANPVRYVFPNGPLLSVSGVS